MSLMNLLQSDDPAIQNGLLNFGLSLLQSKGNFGNAVGQAGVAGQLGARDFRRQQALMSRSALGDQLLQSQIDEEKLKVKDRDAAARRKLEVDQYLQSLQPVQGINANQATGIAGPTPQAAAAIGQRPAIDPMQALRLLGPEGAKALFDAQNWGRPKVARTVESVDAQGNKVIKQLDDYGQEQGAGIPGYVPPQLINQGNKQTFAIPRAGASFDVGMSPTDLDASRRGWANVGISREGLGLQRDRLALDKNTAASGAKAPGGMPSESERTAGFLLQRIRDSQRQLAKAVTDDSSAASPGIAQEAIRVGSEPLANAVTGSSRQQVESAQLDILDAALTLGTGAAYTREQLLGYRKSYFPQIGDKPATIKDKADRLQNLIRAAEVKAGRAATDTGATTNIEAAGGGLPSESAIDAEIRRRRGGSTGSF